ncbi:MAG TPA: penicillin-binding transpeptidase domain-containing protein [Chitinophagaceae bacterium]|nr:penicillin-binding transpeptidase domain-containing protein [Chitinophagaceae bacterium]
MKNYLVLFILISSVFISCKRNNIQEQTQWSSIFQKYKIDSVCFELADNSHEQVFYYNLSRLSRPYSPASTFKIMNSLVALETNIAPDENMIIKWDGITRWKPDWNKDMDMREAFKVSSVPYYQELARRIGEVEMQKWLDTVKYGNRRIGPKIDEFWLNDTLKISADEQVGLMKKLYFDKLPFSQRALRIVRSLMLQEDTENYRLYFKTGTRMDDQTTMGWLVGFIERKEVQKGVLTKKEETNYKPYFFALNMETNDTTMDTRSVRIAMLKDLLKERKIIQ